MRLGFKPQGWDLGLEAGVWASRLGFRPRGRDLGLEVGIWASRLGFGALKLGFSERGWETKEKEKYPHA